MDCHDSRLLIDERVHGSLNGDLLARLEEHLRGCSDCRDDLRQLEKTRELLGAARGDRAPEQELRAVWNAIQKATVPNMSTASMAAPSPTVIRKQSGPITLSRWRKVAIASVMAAAVFVMALTLGHPKRSRFGRKEVAIAAKDDTIRRQETLLAQEKADKDGLEEQNKALAKQNTEEDVPTRRERFQKGDLQVNAYEVPALPSPPAEPVPQHRNGDPVLQEHWASNDVFPIGGGSGNEHWKARTSDPAYQIYNFYSLAGSYAPTDPKLPDTQRGPATGGDHTAKSADVPTPKIIKTGELMIEIKNFAESSRAAEALVAKFQGQIADSRTTDLPGAAKRGDIVIRVAPERFEELFGELKKLGVVLQDRAGAADITAQYVDTEARIKNMQVEEERLQDLIKSKTYMDKIQSLLEVERELARVRGEIESMQGQMRVWQNQIGLSTIRLTLQESSRAVPSGSLSVEVQNLSDAKKALDAALTNAGAQLLNGQSSKRGDGTLMGTYSLRVKFGRFAELASAIKGLGRVQDEKIQNQPFASGVPEGAQDVPCELALVLFERSIQLPSGNVQIEVGALPDAMQKLELALATAQGTVVSNQSQRQSNGAASAQISIRVRAGNFATLVDALPALGRVATRTIGGESGKVQGGAADVPCTLDLHLYEQQKEVPGGTIAVEVSTFTAARDALSALIKDEGLQVRGSESQQRSDGTWVGSFTIGIKAEKMDSVIGKVEKLGRVKSREVRGLGLGDLSRIDPNVVGEIAVTIQEAPTIAPQEEGSFRLMMRDTFGGFLTSMGYVIRGLGMMLPWLLLVALIGGLIWRGTRPKADEKSAPKS
jgi:hypothetical protein